MASAEASTGDHDERKIANHCAIIEKLFSARPQPVVTLKEHITQLEKAIAFLPKQKPRLIELYRDKVIQYWQLFEYGEMAQVGGKEPAPATLPPVFQSYHHSGPPPLANGGSVLNAGDSYALFGDWGTGGGDAAFSRFRRPGQWEREQQSLPSAEIVRETLRAAFDRLGKISSLEENFEGMKALLVLVTKARALTMVYWKNVSLLADIFSYAFKCLPDSMQQLYSKTYSNKKMWLKDLRMFIQQEIDLFVVMHYADSAAGAEERLKKSKKSLCFYCKLNGHIAEGCPVLVSTLCVKCFSYGHTDFRCPNETVFVRLEHFSP